MHACEPYCSVRTSNGHYEQQLLAKMLIPFDLSRNPTFEDFVLFQNSIEKDDDDMSQNGITRKRTLKNVKRNKQLNSKDVFNTVQHTMSSRKAKSVLHIKKTVRIMRRPERVPSSTEDADSSDSDQDYESEDDNIYTSSYSSDDESDEDVSESVVGETVSNKQQTKRVVVVTIEVKDRVGTVLLVF